MLISLRLVPYLAIEHGTELLKSLSKLGICDISRDVFNKDTGVLCKFQGMLFRDQHSLKLLSVNRRLINDGSAFAHWMESAK